MGDVTQDMQQNRAQEGKELKGEDRVSCFCSGACLGTETSGAPTPAPGALPCCRGAPGTHQGSRATKPLPAVSYANAWGVLLVAARPWQNLLLL